jgi:serine protease
MRPHVLELLWGGRRWPAAAAATALVLAATLLGLPGRNAGAEQQPGRVGAASNPAVRHAADHVLVKLAPGTQAARVLPNGHRPAFGRWLDVPVNAGETPIEAVRRLAATPDVEVAELDYAVGTGPIEAVPASRLGASALTPNDPFYPAQWNFPKVQAPDAWTRSTGLGVKVAVVDSGVAEAADDLACRTFSDEKNILTGATGPAAADDDFGHGTHVAGTIAECTNNGVGVAGLAFDATIMPVKVLDSQGRGLESDVAAGINWATTHGAKVINLSLGTNCTATWPTCSSSIINDAIDAAAAADVVIVASSGNSNLSFVASPANHPKVLGVGAVRFDLNRTSYSNYGSALSLTAPGGDLDVDQNGDGIPDGIVQETLGSLCGSPDPFDYCLLEGTSMAAPHVAAAAAMLRAYKPAADALDVRAALQSTALDRGAAGRDTQYGNGVLQIDKALRNVDAAMTTGGFASGVWRLSNRHADGVAAGALTTLSFGRAGDVPVVGDWDGNGTQTIGVVRGNLWYLRDSNAGGSADHTFSFGRADDQFLIGDWDGNGTWTPGVRRGNTFYLKNSFAGGAADITVAYGRASDQAYVGDWNGDGRFTPGVRRDKTFYLKDSFTGGAADTVVSFGLATDEVHLGDWDGNGTWTPGLLRGGTRWFLQNSFRGGAADITFSKQTAGTAVVGDWDGRK